jgi:hypothetical protein
MRGLGPTSLVVERPGHLGHPLCGGAIFAAGILVALRGIISAGSGWTVSTRRRTAEGRVRDSN